MNKSLADITFWIVIFFFLTLGIDSIIITYPDEGRNAFATLFMINSGEFIVPYYNGEIRYDKPPLLYYLGIVIYKTLQFLGYENIELSFRLISVFATIFSAFIVFELSKHFVQNRTYQYLSVILYIGFINIFIESKAFVPEPLLSLFINLSLLSFFKLYRQNQDNTITWIYIFWISMGLGILSKGIISIIIVFLVITVFLLIQRKFYFLKTLFIKPLAVLIGVSLGFSWFIMVGIKTKGDFLYHFFMVHNVGRFTGASNMHPNPFYFYIPVLIINTIPVIEVFTLSLVSFIKNIKNKDELKNVSFLLVYFLTIIVFYSLSKGKVHHYIMPSLIPLSILISLYIEKLIDNEKNLSKLIFLLYLLPIAALFIKLPIEFMNLKKYLLITFIIFPILYFIVLNFNKNLLLHITGLKILIFYIIITTNISVIFPNQKDLFQTIRGNTIFMVGDISTISFYNLYQNKISRTEDIWYIINTKSFNQETIREIQESLYKNKEIL
ncbi:MAG: glycosyltransferase family 39 protein, partial [bacterium]|nr:glycosyltransferase family 39 protein [bacterium]